MSAQSRQMLGSLLVALAIVALTILVVTAKFGPTSAAEREAADDRRKERLERLEERQELRERRLDRRD